VDDASNDGKYRPPRVCDLSTIARETELLSANGRVAPAVGEVFRAVRAKPNFPTGPEQLVSESESEFIVYVGHSQQDSLAHRKWSYSATQYRKLRAKSPVRALGL